MSQQQQQQQQQLLRQELTVSQILRVYESSIHRLLSGIPMGMTDDAPLE
jgi:hypothetical protein